ncbi:hypothetical protein M917_1351 [Psychrobacter aquaticus CMS 56]|uniref:Uncharacterized protein n=1 Tax=Psychrobacter aquaticus CMS 56 TaxID=1354303 RepID=U4TA92_9GAMM|nr:hypothetical protein M917_1351 [Psychrobacter aquaticus CMS 56]
MSQHKSQSISIKKKALSPKILYLYLTNRCFQTLVTKTAGDMNHLLFS